MKMVWSKNSTRPSRSACRNIECTSICVCLAYVAWQPGRGGGGGGLHPYKRLIRMCRWMGRHFHDWSDFYGVAFSVELLEWGRAFSDF